ncbi:MAG: outer membrane beta-barrel protein [Caulobacter sp.]|nr:outer membrane beta-barrel protein [Caulobacter sp.]
MKTYVIAAAAACALLAAPAVASAETNWYADIGYTSVNVEELDANLGLGQIRVGALFTPNLGIEGELALGLSDDTVDFLGTPVKVEMTSLAAGYVVLNWPVSDRIDIFMRAGYATFEVEADAGGGAVSESGSDSAVGFGVKGFFTENDGVRADWTNYGGTDSFSIAYVRRF